MADNEIEITLDVDNNSEIDVNIESKIPDPEYYTKAETNQLLKTKANVTTVEGIAQTLDSVGETVSVQGEAIEANSEAITVNAEAISEHTEAIGEINESLDILMGDESSSGSVANAIAQAEAYTDSVKGEILEGVSDTLTTNYWTKYETAAAIANIQTMAIVVVTELPPIAEAEEYTLYLVPADYSDSEEHPNNVYDEYLVINHQFEKIGSTEVDLSRYAKLEGGNAFIGNNSVDGIFSVTGDSTFTGSLTVTGDTTVTGSSVQVLVPGESNPLISVVSNLLTLGYVNINTTVNGYNLNFIFKSNFTLWANYGGRLTRLMFVDAGVNKQITAFVPLNTSDSVSFNNKDSLGVGLEFVPAYVENNETVAGSVVLSADNPLTVNGTTLLVGATKATGAVTALGGISLTDGTTYGKFVQGYAVGSREWNSVGAYSFSGNTARAAGYKAAAFGDTTNEVEGCCAFSAGGANGAYGSYAVALGLGCIASGNRSFADGEYCRANAHNSFVIQYYNNVGAYALRNSNVCLGCYAEGGYNVVTGDKNNLNQYNHVEGYGNTVGKNISNVIISANYSHVEGAYNYVGDSYQHVAGKYNEPTTGARVTGGGDENTRKNIEELDWQGNLKIAGDLTIDMNGTPVTLSSLIARIEALEAQLQ